MQGCGAGSGFGLITAAGGGAGNPEWLPELAGSGAIRHPLPRRAHRSVGLGAQASALELLVPLLLLPGGYGSPVQVTLYSTALGVAISQACYATGDNHERAVLRQLLGELDLKGALIKAVALHTQRLFLSNTLYRKGFGA